MYTCHDRTTYTIVSCDRAFYPCMHLFSYLQYYGVSHTHWDSPAFADIGGSKNGSNVPPMCLCDSSTTPKPVYTCVALYVFVGIVARHFCALSMSWCLLHVWHRFLFARVDLETFAVYGKPKVPFARHSSQMFVQISLYIIYI